MDDEDDFTFDD